MWCYGGGLVAYAGVGGLVVNVGALVVMLVALADGFCRCFWLTVLVDCFPVSSAASYWLH